MRDSNQQYHNGQLHNGFDYDLQVWVKAGVILDCGHPATMSRDGYYCCNAKKYNGEKVTEVRAQLSI